MLLALGTIGNPIRCHDPVGEWKYLHQLISETHGFIQYKRMGSFHTESSILDGYAIFNLQGDKFAELYFDMYHSEYIEELVPEGFQRIDPEVVENQLFEKMLASSRVTSNIHGQIVIGQDNHGYVEAKAQRLLLCGPLYYRTQDYFGYPHLDWNWAEIVDASRQLVEKFSGRLDSNPIIVSNAEIAKQLLKTFHFDSENAAVIDSTGKAELICATHIVTGEPLQFWFQSSTFVEEKLP